MAFETLLGNDRLKENLERSLKAGRISHFYLISGPEGAGKRTLAKLLATAILCRESSRGCGSCPHCRKMASGNHPDYITVTDPDHKNVAVKIVRQIRDDMFIRPNEAEHKIYLFPQELGTEGQNALLKILEEPPAYGVFLLLTDNPEKLLPTVRSRCTELKLQALPRDILVGELAREFPQADRNALEAAAQRSGGWLGQAKQLLSDREEDPRTEAFAQALGSRDELLLATTLAAMEKIRRDELIKLLGQWLQLTEAALVSRSGLAAVSAQARTLAQNRTAQDLYRAAGALKQALEYAHSNVSPGAVCGWLSWELR